MKKTIKILAPFFVLIIIQWFIPLNMIFEQEDILNTGTAYKFKTAPVDPYDPFRGKYITLSFDISSFSIESNEEWTRGETIYIILSKDQEGFAKMKSYQRQVPSDVDYLKCTVSSSYGNTLRYNIPFNRFYMEESKAQKAEDEYRVAARDNDIDAYALVMIKDGNGCIQNVFIDDQPILEYLENID
jgi:uncharacterized membrane-anchored protein